MEILTVQKVYDHVKKVYDDVKDGKLKLNQGWNWTVKLFSPSEDTNDK